MAPPGPAREALADQFGPVGTAPARLVRRAAIAAAAAALCGGAWLLAQGSAMQGAPSIAQANIGRGHPSAAPIAKAPGQASAITAGQVAELVLDNGKNRAGQYHGSLEVKPVSAAPMIVRTPPAALTAAPPPAAAQPLAPAPAAAVAPLPPPAADSAASAATLGELRMVMDQCRDAIREVIRLGARQRPGRGASAEEQVGHRLRQQNADAAKGYRSYLGMLSRSVRGKTSETSARQSLDKARQTLAYLETMLADSQASLR